MRARFWDVLFYESLDWKWLFIRTHPRVAFGSFLIIYTHEHCTMYMEFCVAKITHCRATSYIWTDNVMCLMVLELLCAACLNESRILFSWFRSPLVCDLSYRTTVVADSANRDLSANEWTTSCVCVWFCQCVMVLKSTMFCAFILEHPAKNDKQTDMYKIHTSHFIVGLATVWCVPENDYENVRVVLQKHVEGWSPKYKPGRQRLSQSFWIFLSVYFREQAFYYDWIFFFNVFANQKQILFSLYFAKYLT